MDEFTNRQKNVLYCSYAKKAQQKGQDEMSKKIWRIRKINASENRNI